MAASVLVTGFEPFDGRQTNASWIAARSLALTPNVRVLCLPVVWGAPFETLHALCSEDCPQTILALGEGRDGWFDIETRARNTRADREDNTGTCTADPIVRGGPESVKASINAGKLRPHHERYFSAIQPDAIRARILQLLHIDQQTGVQIE